MHNGPGLFNAPVLTIYKRAVEYMRIFKRSLNPFKRFNVVELELDGTVPEEEDRYLIPFIPRKRKLTVLDIERIFHHIAFEPGIRVLLIKIRSLRIGLAKAQTIARCIRELRRNGKKVFAYLESPGNIEYMIGSGADKVFIAPWAILNLIGLKAEVTFFKSLLDKAGVEANFKGMGEYKTAAETFTRDSMSEKNREMLEALYDDLNEKFLDYIAQGRGLSPEEAKRVIDNGPYTSKEALDESLVDGILYEEEIKQQIQESIQQNAEIIKASNILKLLKLKSTVRYIAQTLKGRASAIAFVSDTGIITLGESRSGGLLSKTIGTRTMLRMLERAERDRAVRALVLRISSPGGSGIASDLILNKLRSIARKMPVVVSMSDVAASGGYMIALGATKIVAESTTITGSIGIVSGKFNLAKLYEKLGITQEYISRGRRALMYSSARGFTEEEEQNQLQIMEELYTDFVNKVAVSRNLEYTAAEKISRGRVWTGKQARELGLVDELGGVMTAVKLAMTEAGLPPDEEPLIKTISKPMGIRLPMLRTAPTVIQELDSAIQLAKALEREGVFALMPFWMDFD